MRGLNLSILGALAASTAVTLAVALPLSVAASRPRVTATVEEAISSDDDRFPPPLILDRSELAIGEIEPTQGTPTASETTTTSPDEESTAPAERPTPEPTSVLPDDFVLNQPSSSTQSDNATVTESVEPRVPAQPTATPRPAPDIIDPGPEPTVIIAGPVPRPSPTPVPTQIRPADPRRVPEPDPTDGAEPTADLYVQFLGAEGHTGDATSTVRVKGFNAGPDQTAAAQLTLSVASGSILSASTGRSGWSCTPASAQRWVCAGPGIVMGEGPRIAVEVQHGASETAVVSVVASTGTLDPANGNNVGSMTVARPEPPDPTTTATPTAAIENAPN